jgi:tRNA-guanine family transglycosylase
MVGAVKGVTPASRALGAEIVLANAYHLPCVRARYDRESRLPPFMVGGLVLTDSGGFPSARRAVRLEEDGVRFRSHPMIAHI